MALLETVPPLIPSSDSDASSGHRPSGSSGRVFNFSFAGIPAIDQAMQARLEATARRPAERGRYPVITEAPDA